MIRVAVPYHLRVLAGIGAEVNLDVAPGADGTVRLDALLDTLERAYPVLRGTIRDQRTGVRRPFLRFFACGEDLSHGTADQPLPAAVLAGAEPLRIVGAIVGG